MDVSAVSEYLSEVRSQLASGHAKEHAYRPALQRLMRGFDDVEAINDPAHSEHGAPDFIFQRESNRDLILGYAEAKDIVGIDLDKVERSDQMHRYAGYQNLYLTDYLEFRFFRDGEKYKTISIGQVVNGVLVPDPDEYQRLINELQAFLELPPQRITSGKKLAEIMGAKTRRIRDDIQSYFEKEAPSPNTELVKIYNLMRTMLLHDLDHAKFADMYAQTLVYGLFVARYSDTSPETFNREEARSLVPKTNPFLQHFFDHIVGPEFDERLGRAVDELCDAFRVSDVKTIVHRYFGQDEDRDPIIHFYEDFLKAYDPAVRKRMGAYYTPLAVVNYIVRQVDEVLKNDFGVVRGLADTSKVTTNHRTYLSDLHSGEKTKRYKDERIEYHRVQVLDPAVGTATFLNEVIKFLHCSFVENGQEGRWPSYVNENLLPRLNGFELMMAPYTIAHLKLGMTLEDTGVRELSKRLGIYLTNTLEEGIPHQPDLFSLGLMEAVTEEARIASQIKSDRPVMVVLGNPPYSAVSSNETDYANSLIEKYKVEPGGHSRLNEQKHWLNDDYVKFIAFAEDMIVRNGSGVMAMITNHGYLDNATFRGMRWRLSRTFDRIRVIDLHGNVARREQSPDGERNENVFNITQGVSIIVAVRLEDGHSDDSATVEHSELWGTRKQKFKALNDDTLDWQTLQMNRRYDFVPRGTEGFATYKDGVAVPDLFHVYKTGLVTMGDPFIVAESKEELRERIAELRSGTLTADDLKKKFSLGKNYAEWVTSNIDDVGPFDEAKVVPYAYRPFDTRLTYFEQKLIWRWRIEMSKHVVWHKNISLIVARQAITDNWSHVQMVDTITDNRFQYSNKGIPVQIPLYLYDEGGESRTNLVTPAMKKLCANLSETPDPTRILEYVYGVLHSPVYRKRFLEYLKLDFPRVPIPADDEEFDAFADVGRTLQDLHLMTGPARRAITTFPVAGSDSVERAEFVDGSIWINESQYFGKVPLEAWEFYMSGYQPAQKWLKDRLGRTLADADLDHYQQMISILVRTQELMDEVASIPASWNPGL